MPSAVGEVIFTQMLRKAAKLGHPTYVVGINYGKGIEVRIERYHVANKQAKQVTHEVRETMARLSGLEYEVEAGYGVNVAEGTSAAVSRRI